MEKAQNHGVMYGELTGWLVNGNNIKANGERREWRAVMTGKLRPGKRGIQCHVIDLNIQDENKRRKERGERAVCAFKWLALWSFTGKIDDIEIIEGRRKDGQKIFNV